MEQRLKKIKDHLVRKKVGEFEIYLERSKSHSIEVQDQHIESYEVDDSFNFSIRILNKEKSGFAYGTNFSTDTINFAVNAAIENANYTTKDKCYGWSHRGGTFPQVNNCDKSLEKRTKKEKIDLVCELEKKALDTDSRVDHVRSNCFNDVVEDILLFNSSGLHLHHQKTHHHLGLMAVSIEGKYSEVYQDSIYSPFWNDLNVAQLGRETAQGAVALLGSKKMNNYKGPIILIPQVASEMLEVLAPSVLMENVHKKNSYLIGKENKKVYSSKTTLIDNGLHPKGEASSPFDAEGTPRQKTTVIQEGVVNHFLYDFYWSKKYGVSSTGNSIRKDIRFPPLLGISNFYLEPGTRTQKQLITKMDRGIMVSEIIGMHTADPVSGDFSVGIQGLFIENGEKKYPIHQMVLTGNIHDFLSQLEDIGSDLKFYGSTGSPSMLISQANLSGES